MLRGGPPRPIATVIGAVTVTIVVITIITGAWYVDHVDVVGRGRRPITLGCGGYWRVVSRLTDLVIHVFGLVHGAFQDVGQIFDFSNKMGGGWVEKIDCTWGFQI